MSEIILDLPGDRTDLYARTRKMVREAYETLYREKLKPWRFFYVKPLQCTDCRGNPVRYGGVKFEGSPRDVFWGGFIEPCLADITVQVLDATALNCQKGHLKPDAYLREAADLLKVFVQKVYENMDRTDQVLLGEGFPDRIKPRDITAKLAAMSQLITGHLRATLITQPAIDIHSEHLEVHKRIKEVNRWVRLKRNTLCIVTIYGQIECDFISIRNSVDGIPPPISSSSQSRN